MKKADIERMISLADDRYIDEIFQDKITGRRKNIFVTFTAVAAALALVAGGISYFVSNAGNADKITADDTIVSELGIVDYSLYFQNYDEPVVENDDWSVGTDGIFCYFSDSEYVKSVMPFDMSRFVNASCHFYYNYKDEVKTVLMHASDRIDDLQENVKMLNVEVYERGELFPHLSLGKCKSMKRFGVDVYGFDLRGTDNGGTVGVIFAMDGKEYLISGNYMSFDEIGLIMDSIIENGLWTDSFDLSRAEVEYGDIRADITLEEANLIEPFAGHVPQIYTFGDMRLNFNKVSYQAGRDEENGIVPQWLYFTYYDGGEQDICLQYFTDGAGDEVQPLEKTVAIDDIELDKLSEFRHDGNNHTFTVDCGKFKINVWTNSCADDELLECITAVRIGANGVISHSSKIIPLAEANNIVPFAGYVPQCMTIGSMSLVNVYTKNNDYTTNPDMGKSVSVFYQSSQQATPSEYISLLYMTADRSAETVVAFGDSLNKLESLAQPSKQENYNCSYYNFNIDCGDFCINVNAECTPGEMEQCIRGIWDSKDYTQYNITELSLDEARADPLTAGFVPQTNTIGDMSLENGTCQLRELDGLQHIIIKYSDPTFKYDDERFNYYGKYLTAKYVENDGSEEGVTVFDEIEPSPVFDINDNGVGKYKFTLDCGDIYIKVEALCNHSEMWEFLTELKNAAKGTAVSDANDKSGNLLTIDKVKELAKKGDDLTWSDFDGYTFTEGGSGLYIRSYAVEGGYNLMVSGTGRETKPMYMYLSCEGKGKIDIRYDSIDEFLN